jgi:hypothetical protein
MDQPETDILVEYPNRGNIWDYVLKAAITLISIVSGTYCGKQIENHVKIINSRKLKSQNKWLARLNRQSFFYHAPRPKYLGEDVGNGICK